MMDTSKSVLPSQQKTYSKALRSSSAMRSLTPWLNGVKMTMGMCG